MIVSVTDKASPELRKMLSRVQDTTGILKRLGLEGRKILLDHFRRKDKTPNKAGFPRAHFWGQIRTAVGMPIVTPGEARIPIGDYRLRHKVEGGTLRSPSGRRLAIPLNAAAAKAKLGKAGKEAAFPGLFVLRGKRASYLATGSGKKLTLHYILLASVHQDPDPTALPGRAEFDTRIMERLHNILMRKPA